jgi:hypothetical protein
MIKVDWLASLRVGGAACIGHFSMLLAYNLQISPANGKKSLMANTAVQ